MHQTERYYIGYLLKELPVLYYDFGADVTHDTYPTAANFRSIAAYFDQKTSTKTARNGRQSFKKGTLPTTKNSQIL